MSGSTARIAGLSLVFVALACGVAWVRWHGSSSSADADVTPSPVVRAPPKAKLEVASDDREPEEQRYQSEVKANVDALLASDATTIEARARALPTAALPLLQDALDARAVPAAAEAPVAAALASDPDRLRAALEARRRLDWYRQNVLDVFETHRLSERVYPARITLEAAVREWARDPRASGDEGAIVLREAIASHVDRKDDLLLLLAWIGDYVRLNDSDKAWVFRAAPAVADSFMDSDYPAIWKMESLLLGIRAIYDAPPVSEASRKRAERFVEQCDALFPDVLADPELPRRALINLFDRIGQASLAMRGERHTLANPLFEQLQKSAVPQTTVLAIQGLFNKDYAWDARGSGTADTVGASAQQVMTQRLARAATALEEAWRLDPTNENAARGMIGVELGQGQGRDRMELWFDRAMRAYPDDYAACADKLYYLEPKWYGDAEQMLKFGRECVAGGNYDAGLPYILVEAHQRLAHYTATGWQQRPQPSYFRNNPQAWEDIRSVYEEDRKHRPRSVQKETRFALVATWTRHWDEANRTFDEIGDAWDTSDFTREEIDRFKAEVRAHRAATQPAAPPV